MCKFDSLPWMMHSCTLPDMSKASVLLILFYACLHDAPWTKKLEFNGTRCLSIQDDAEHGYAILSYVDQQVIFVHSCFMHFWCGLVFVSCLLTDIKRTNPTYCLEAYRVILNTHKACYFQKILPVSLDVLVPPYPPRQAAWATLVPCYKCLACDEEFHCNGHDIGVLHMVTSVCLGSC